jgi:ribosomal-protein-alanine N-acetyltransferase
MALPPDLHLQKAGIAEIDLLAALHAAGFGEAWDRPWSRQSFAEILALPGASGLIALIPDPDQPQPVGFGLTLGSGPEVELLLLAVLPAWRRRGIARHLLFALLREAAAAGATRALLEVAAANRAAIACYAAAGFTPCGRRRDYYAPGIDAVLYERFLTTTSIGKEIRQEPGNKCE